MERATTAVDRHLLMDCINGETFTYNVVATALPYLLWPTDPHIDASKWLMRASMLREINIVIAARSPGTFFLVRQ